MLFENLTGLGTNGKLLKEHMSSSEKNGLVIYVSSMSCENRGITDKDLDIK